MAGYGSLAPRDDDTPEVPISDAPPGYRLPPPAPPPTFAQRYIPEPVRNLWEDWKRSSAEQGETAAAMHQQGIENMRSGSPGRMLLGAGQEVLGTVLPAVAPINALFGTAQKTGARTGPGLEHAADVASWANPEALTGDVAKASTLAMAALPAKTAGKVAEAAEVAKPVYDSWHDALIGKEHGATTQPAGATERGVAEAAPGVPGGAGGGAAGLGEAPVQAERTAAEATARRIAGEYDPLPGLPTKALKVGDSLYVPGPIGKVNEVAEAYMRGRPLPGPIHAKPEIYHPLDEEHSRAIAQAFEDMKHEPDNPAVKASYAQMIKETRDQYRAIRQNHPDLQIVPNEGGVDPYAATPRLAARDVGENNRLHFFPTEQGYGTGEQGGIDMSTHPMMQPSGETLNGKPLLNNDLFRIVHDYFGHLKEGYGFRAAGEDNAWRSHASMYSDLARPAMTTETRGQNSWVNFGPHAAENKGASGANTIYADQKVGLMPEWTMRDRNSPAPIITYQGSPSAHSYIDMSKVGSGEGSGVRGRGMYSADHESIAEWYRHQLAARFDPLLKRHGLKPDQGSTLGIDIANAGGDHQKVIQGLQDFIEENKARVAGGDTSAATSNFIKNSQKMVDYLNDPRRFRGHMYELAIDKPEEQFLHWDKTLAEQSPYVQEKMKHLIAALEPSMMQARASLAQRAQDKLAFSNLSPTMRQKYEADLARNTGPVDWQSMPGKRLYEMSAHAQTGKIPLNQTEGYPLSSEYLRSKGIAGVKYESGTIHKSQQGHHNYVTFDAPRILRRYAIPGMLGGAGLGASILSRQGEDDGT